MWRSKKIKRKYLTTINSNSYIAHALGEVDGQSYTNSKEAIENTLSKGVKLLEVDVKLTSDGKLACVHGWTKKDYEGKLGLTYNKENSIMTYDEFMNIKIKNKYTTMSFEDLVNYMKEYSDIYVMIDIGRKSYDETLQIYEEILNITNDKKVLNRLITGGHTTDMISAEKEVYDFKLINLYWSGDKLEEGLNTKEKFAEYCLKNNITSLSVSYANYSEELVEYMKEKGIIVYVFTVNDEETAKELLKSGVDIVGTDTLI